MYIAVTTCRSQRKEAARCEAARGFGDSAPPPAKQTSKGSKAKAKAKRRTERITPDQVQAARHGKADHEIWRLPCTASAAGGAHARLSHPCRALQAVDRAVRIAEGSATRPVNSAEAAKGRLDYVQVGPCLRCVGTSQTISAAVQRPCACWYGSRTSFGRAGQGLGIRQAG